MSLLCSDLVTNMLNSFGTIIILLQSSITATQQVCTLITNNTWSYHQHVVYSTSTRFKPAIFYLNRNLQIVFQLKIQLEEKVYQ